MCGLLAWPAQAADGRAGSLGRKVWGADSVKGPCVGRSANLTGWVLCTRGLGVQTHKCGRVCVLDTQVWAGLCVRHTHKHARTCARVPPLQRLPALPCYRGSSTSSDRASRPDQATLRPAALAALAAAASSTPASLPDAQAANVSLHACMHVWEGGREGWGHMTVHAGCYVDLVPMHSRLQQPM